MHDRRLLRQRRSSVGSRAASASNVHHQADLPTGHERTACETALIDHDRLPAISDCRDCWNADGAVRSSKRMFHAVFMPMIAVRFWDVLVDSLQRIDASRNGSAWRRTRVFAVCIIIVFCVLINRTSAALDYSTLSNSIPRGVSLPRKVCETVEIRNLSAFSLLENCTVIEGSLSIVLIKTQNSSRLTKNINQLSFPALREITGFLVLWRVNGLFSIGTLFPNLTVIRGFIRFHGDYSLIVFENNDLKEIGLYSLTNILQGSVRITENKDLCYYDTVDWNALAPNGRNVIQGVPGRNGDFCPNKCPSKCAQNGNHCWNKDHCQIDLRQCRSGRLGNTSQCCHESCLGGCTGNTSKDCVACKNVTWEGDCLPKCLSNTVKYLDRRCVTVEECYKFLRPEFYPNRDPSRQFPYRPVHGECALSCPPLHDEHSRIVNSRTYFECKACHGDCIKKCHQSVKIDSISAAERAASMGCTHIMGALEVVGMRGSNVSKELEKALGSVVYIKGYLKIARMKQLISLNFLKNLRTIEGDPLDNQNVFILQNNDNLQHLWNWPNGTNATLEIKRGKLFFHYNPKLCYSKIEKLVEVTKVNFTEEDAPIQSNGDQVACNVTVMHAEVVTIKHSSVLIRWPSFRTHDDRTLLGYEIHYVEAPEKNVTMYEGRDACKDDGWMVVDVVKQDTTNMTHIISQLKPYTQYAYYVKTYTLKTENNGAQSNIDYFRTAPSTPTLPINVKATAQSTSEILVSWQPPTYPNGELTHYNVSWITNRERIAEDRNYCSDSSTPKIAFNSAMSVNHLLKITDKEKIHDRNETKDECCKCEVEEGSKPILNKEDDFYLDGIIFENSIQNYYYVKNMRREVRSVNTGEAPELRDWTTVHVPNTEVLLKNLRYSTLYQIYVQACVKDENLTLGLAACSNTKIINDVRTLRNDSADYIRDIEVDTNRSNGTVSVSWTEPPLPNGIVLSYKFERVFLDTNVSSGDCKMQRDLVPSPHRPHRLVYLLPSLEPGRYKLRFHVLTSAGSGPWTEYKTFQVVGSRHSGNSTMDIFVGVIIAVVLIIVFITGWICWRRFHPKVPKLFPVVNPDYIPTDYIADEWEVPRESIELVRELGQGSFGMVYEGVAHDIVPGHSRVPCAVKTVNESANIRDRQEFLNEACVMKTFNTPHVVRLLGVVSKGQPTLVVMELMANGDLKSYLRSHRPDSGEVPHPQPPTLKRIYQMAIEIADGMAYLTAKKFVHRDLAARNCMVADDLTVKIGDFGMTRDIYETDYYKKGTKGLLPVRWMAPESLKDGVFTNRSDVWSYGVVLWEMITLASQPYQGLSNDQVLRYVIDGGVMARPENCPDRLYELMKLCWQHRPHLRPTFMELVSRLLADASQKFLNNSFYNSPEGAELRMHEAEVQAVELEASFGTPLTPLRATTELDEDDEFASADDIHLRSGDIPLMPASTSSAYIRPMEGKVNNCNGANPTISANGYIIGTMAGNGRDC